MCIGAVEDCSSSHTFSSQSSYHSTDSLYGAEANKDLTLVKSFSLLSRFIRTRSPSLTLKDKIVVPPSTGDGNSLCFEFPPVYLNKKAIIMPTITLMRDQTIQVNEMGIHGLSN